MQQVCAAGAGPLGLGAEECGVACGSAAAACAAAGSEQPAAAVPGSCSAAGGSSSSSWRRAGEVQQQSRAGVVAVLRAGVLDAGCYLSDCRSNQHGWCAALCMSMLACRVAWIQLPLPTMVVLYVKALCACACVWVCLGLFRKHVLGGYLRVQWRCVCALVLGCELVV